MELLCIQMTLRMKLLICNIAKLMFFYTILTTSLPQQRFQHLFSNNANVNTVLNNSKIAEINFERKTKNYNYIIST